ncbi:MAG: putative DNA binding domain-containing protein [Pyrinomonadaceae bacterium]|nr:putative DNA binding domain-containing protein [Pyrinomonadaceae bacterium]MDW8305265.1 putative DNA binding domain-containing protein [Acidobacteriota bacterium]
MTRKKFRYGERWFPSSERSLQEYLINQSSLQISRNDLLRMIRGGEDTYLELKVKLSNPEKISQEIVAIANTVGGFIIFGVTDKLRIEGVDYPEEVISEIVRICREEIIPPIIPIIDTVSFDNGRRIVVLEIQGKHRPYRTREGRVFLRIGTQKREATREELSDLIQESSPMNYENLPVPGATKDDIDDALLWSFARAFEDISETSLSYNTEEFLKRDLLLATGSGEDFTPTVAAILLFGKNDRVSQLLPRSTVTVTRYSGNSPSSPVVEEKVLEGNLTTLFESAIRFIKKYCDLMKEKPKLRTQPSPIPARQNYSENVIREAITNALIHRDLALREAKTRICIFDDSIEIINSRRHTGFVPFVSKAICYGITQRINPQIAAIFTSPAYEIELGSRDFPSMLREAQMFSGKKPEFSIINDEFHLKIHGI